MALEFDGADDAIEGTMAAINTGDWTLGAIVRLQSFGGGGGNGRICRVDSGGGPIQELRCGSLGRFEALQGFTTTHAFVASPPSLLVAGRWYVVAAVYTAALQRVTLYWAELGAGLATAINGQTQGAGTRATLGTEVTVGNLPGGIAGFDGDIAAVFLTPYALSANQLAPLTVGDLSPAFALGDPRFCWQLTTEDVWDLGVARADPTSVVVQGVSLEPLAIGFPDEARTQVATAPPTIGGDTIDYLGLGRSIAL